MPDITFKERHCYGHATLGITVPVKLHHSGRSIEVEAKVDTGADLCVFDRSVAETLDIDVESGDEIRIETLNGMFVAYGHSLTIRVLGFDFEVDIYFPRDLPTRRNILGRKKWLAQTRLGIIDHDQLLYLSRYDD